MDHEPFGIKDLRRLGRRPVVTEATRLGADRYACRVAVRPTPDKFPVPVVVVQHLDPRHEAIIAEVLGRRTKEQVVLAQDGVRARLS